MTTKKKKTRVVKVQLSVRSTSISRSTRKVSLVSIFNGSWVTLQTTWQRERLVFLYLLPASPLRVDTASWCPTVVTNWRVRYIIWDPCLHAQMLKYQVISCDADPRMKMETWIIICIRSSANFEIASDGQSLLNAGIAAETFGFLAQNRHKQVGWW